MRTVATLIAITLGCTSALAQTYPVKPIRLIVPFGAGSTTDIIGRVIGASLTKDLGQQVVVENKPGAGGTIGGADAARGAPDGYTLVIGTVASHGIGPLTMKDVSYDAVKNFQAITLIANVPNMIAVHPSVPAKTPAELVEFLKSNPGFTFTSAGPGTTAHLAGEFFGERLGLKLTHVPYKAVGQAITDVIGGQVKMIVYQLAGLKAHVDAGTVRPIAATSVTRIPALPNLPTVAETLIAGFDFAPWFGLMAPAGTPRPIVDRLHTLVVTAVQSAEMKKQFDAQGMEPVLKGPDEFQAFMRTDYERWRVILEKAGMRPQ
ncbi:MAG: Bug family tripartite tricarboxylate transporter substrate binding protein [Burkholderiales bacterium]